MSASQVIAGAKQVIAERQSFTPRDLGVLAQRYGMSAYGVCRVLERAGVLPSGTWQRLKSSGLTQAALLLAGSPDAVTGGSA